VSISIVLIPAAVAAATWVAGRGQRREMDGRTVIGVSTRMRDVDLLTGALADTGAVVTSQTDDALVAQWSNVSARFHRDPAVAGGAWQVDFLGEGTTEESVAEVVTAIDTAYGLRVQQAVLTRLRERAPLAGMSIASESVDDNDTVTVVLDLAAGA